MFQFRRFPAYAYLIQRTLREYCSRGFPHSEISGSKDICSSPKLIAACHVLHRLLMPRHSPCALYSLTIEWSLIDQFSSWIMQAIFKSFLWLKLFLPFTFRCCSTIKLAFFQTSSERPLCCLALLAFSSFVQFSRCQLSDFWGQK